MNGRRWLSSLALLSALRLIDNRLLSLWDYLWAHCLFIISGSLNNDFLIFNNIDNLNNLFLSFLNMNLFLLMLGFLHFLDLLNISELLQSLLILFIDLT